MSEKPRIELILSQATEREREYDWLGAGEFYEKALGLMLEMGFLEIGQVHERVGYAFYRAAMQAEGVDQFKDRMFEAVAGYEKAKDFYGRMSEPAKVPRMLRCDAIIAYLGYWLASEVPEKKRLLDESWSLTKEALKIFEEAGDRLEYGKTYSLLYKSAVFGHYLMRDSRAVEKVVRAAVDFGEQTIRFLSTTGNPYELARAYTITACFLAESAFWYLEKDEIIPWRKKALEYWAKANELSEEVAFVELLNTTATGYSALGLGLGSDKAIDTLERALEYGRKTRDKFIVGCALDCLAREAFFKAFGVEDPDKRLELLEKYLQYEKDAKHLFSQISLVSWVEVPYAEYYYELATDETDLGKRRDLLKNAIDAGEGILKRAEASGSPINILWAYHTLSNALESLSKIETDSEKKRRLLETALNHRNESIRISEQLSPILYWRLGFMKIHLADIKSGLADLAKDPVDKTNVLQEAALMKENGLKLCNMWIPFMEIGKSDDVLHSTLARLGRWQGQFGDMLNRLYELTNNKEYLRKALEAFKNGAETAQKCNMTSRAAELHWKAANAYDTLGEHLKAADSFEEASNDYRAAAEKISKFKDFYQGHALHMQAWSEIEKARHDHDRQGYSSAKEHYEKAATILKSLKQWNYLAANYSAWTQLENAEDLSRREKSEEAIQNFEQAARLFKEAKNSVKTELGKSEDTDEKQITSLVKATDLRREYCIGRITIEQAKILDKKGDHYSSSEKYGSAAETFEKIAQELESEQDRKEFNLIITLSRAWQKMTQAEAEASSTLYMEASQLFEQAVGLSPNEKAKMLALGHSRFCRALEAGTKFADTRDATLHSTAIQHLESAANYYVRAGFQNASEYAKATELLLDAYVQMDNAKKESDPEKEARLYAMSEKLLYASADSFMKAEHPEKNEQVLSLLEKVKEERELAVSLNEVLHAPSVVSTTTAFSTPTPAEEKAVGLERFEHADIQANVIVDQKSLKVGENLDLEIELVNAGKGSALLMKVAEAIPEGFELIEKPSTYRVEDGCITMKRKRLDPLKTEELRLVLRPKVQGTFTLKPRIMYLDENGKYKACEPEPATIKVKELGISGWMRGQ